MSIVKMKKLYLLGMLADKDRIFDALVRSNVVQLKRTDELPSCNVENVSSSVEELMVKVNHVEDAVRYLNEQTELFNEENKRNKTVQPVKMPKNSFARPLTEIDYDYFLGFGENVEQIEKDLSALSELRDKIAQLENNLAQNRAERDKWLPYEGLPHPTTWYKNTASAVVQLSQLPTSEFDNLVSLCQQFPLVTVEKIAETTSIAVVVVVAHKTQTDVFEKAAALGLVKCNLTSDVLPRLLIKDLDAQAENIIAQLKETKRQIVAYDAEVLEWKIYIDYLNLCIKKAEASGQLQLTSRTFVLEGYYPASEEENVQKAIEKVSECVVLIFNDIAEDEFAPTLLKNNPVVRQFESVTNMYTPPDYHEVDPNPVMSIFYFIIFGFMVADIGYGVLLMLAGLFAMFAIKQRSGLKTMLQMFGFCGISATAVGALFGSCFSFSLYAGIIPDPSEYPMVMIILSLILGVVHILAGVGCKMAVKIKHKQYLAAWLANFPWIIVFSAFVLAIWNAAIGMAAYEPYQTLLLPNSVGSIALYVALGALAVAIVFAGIGSAGFKGKLTKSLGSVYGIINYLSDIMSYIRVFGLMLSSALIGSVVNMLGSMVSGGGGFGYVFAALILVLAHLLNLVMVILSVYIHNGRLQYVEFFGKFYTGDGQLFVPFGSDTKYTLVRTSPVELKEAKKHSQSAN